LVHHRNHHEVNRYKKVSELENACSGLKTPWSKIGLFLLVILLPSTFLALQSRVDLLSQPANLEQVVTHVSRATFEIKCDSDWTGAGWGLELDDDFYLVTAAHVVEECQNGGFIVARNQTTAIFKLELAGYIDDYWSTDYGTTDLALLKSSQRIPTLRFQSEKVKVGQWVLAAGFPLEEVSGPLLNLNEGRITGFDFNDHIVTDAAMNGGMSGGPLINARGEVLGTVYAGDPVDEFENLGYVQPLFEHCGLITYCLDGKPTYEHVQ
jgi:S1-C subfamily serine protease